MRNTVRTLTAVSLSLCAGSAFAQTASRTETLPEIRVDGGAIGESVQQAFTDRSNAPNAKVVIEGEQLNQFNDLSVGDAIRRLPGVTFSAVNRSREIKLRGIPREYTQVLLDGRPLLDGDSTRSVEVDRIPAVLIDRIEIIRSPLASMGSSGAAGTVNIITKRQNGKPGGGISVGGGYYDKNGPIGDLSGWTGGQAGPINYFIGGGVQRRLLEESSDTFNTIGASSSDGGTLQKQTRRFNEANFNARFEAQLNEQNRLTIAPSYFRTEEYRAQTDRRLNGARTAVNRITDEIRTRDRETIGSYFEWQHIYNTAVSSKVFVDVQKAIELTTRNSTRYSATYVPQQIERRYSPIDLRRIAPGASMTANVAGHVLDMGLGAILLERQESEERQRTLGGNTTPDPTRIYKVGEDVAYGYVSDRFSVLGPDLLTLGVRVESSETRTTDNLGVLRTGTDTAVNPSLQYRYSFTPDLDFRAGIARTVRRPDLRDLTPTISSNSGTIVSPDTRGNPEARPEHIWGVDVGIDKFFDNKLGLVSGNVFARQFDDKLDRTLSRENGRWISTLRNAGEGKMVGVELEARVPLHFIPGLTLWGNAIAVKTELTDSLTQQRRRFAEQPDLVTNIGLDYYVRAWRTTFGINYNRTYAYSQDIWQPLNATQVTNQRTEFNALNRLDFSMRIQVRDDITVSFGALNLLRPIDRRVVSTIQPNGTISAQTITAEPSNATYYVRTSFKF